LGALVVVAQHPHDLRQVLGLQLLEPFDDHLCEPAVPLLSHDQLHRPEQFTQIVRGNGVQSRVQLFLYFGTKLR
jgi:hypothetical protein